MAENLYYDLGKKIEKGDGMIENLYWDLDKDGNPFPAEDESQIHELLAGSRKDERRVGLDLVGDVRVSTVFLVICHYSGVGENHLYETLVEGVGEDEIVQRYRTKEEAKAGHEAIVEELIKSGLGEHKNMLIQSTKENVDSINGA